MGKENGVYTYNGILVSHKIKENPAICDNMDDPGRHAKRRKPVPEGQILHDSTHMRNLKESGSSKQRMQRWLPGPREERKWGAVV